MAKKKLSDLTEKTTLHKDDLFYLVDSEVATDKAKKVKYGTIRPYEVYSVLLNKSGTGVIVPTVLENTLGGVPVWTRNDVGVDYCTLADAFTENKTFAFIPTTIQGSDNVIILTAERGGANLVTLGTFIFTSNGNDATTGADVDFVNLPFEIRVYN